MTEKEMKKRNSSREEKTGIFSSLDFFMK